MATTKLPTKLSANRPKYLLDLDNWEIRHFDELWKDEHSGLQKQGYGAISYSWGKWQHRKKYATNDPNNANDTRYPKFNIIEDGKPISWFFPVMYKSLIEPLVEDALFIKDLQTTLSKMGMRYIWWDWACIPQGPWKAEKGSTEEQWLLSQDLQAIASDQMNKMRYVYPNSRRGIIWAHRNFFSKDSKLGTAITTCCKYYASAGNRKTLGDIKKVISVLQALNEDELWMQSLWCFQEGVLFSHPDRPIDSNEAASVFRDRNSYAVNVPELAADGTLRDLVVVTSSIGATIINILRYHAEAPDTDPFKSGLTQPPSDPNAHSDIEKDPLVGVGPVPKTDPLNKDPNSETFQRWCIDAANEQAARQMLDDIVGTGLVYYTADSPLSLLNARWNRSRGPWTKMEDIAVNTVIGALEVDIQKYLEDAKAVTGTDAEKEKKRLDILSQGMLVELFKTYQWRMLLFATPGRALVPNLKGIWPDLVLVKNKDTKLPPYTSLEYFLGTRNLSERFVPPPPVYDGDTLPQNSLPVPPPAGQFPLPALQLSSDNQYLIVQKLAGFKLFDLSNPKYDLNKPLWTKCTFYNFIKDPDNKKGYFLPIFTPVPFSSWQQVWANGDTDNKVALIPLEYLKTGSMPWEKNKRLRCVVVNHFGNGSDLKYPTAAASGQAAMFVGIADLENTTSTSFNAVPPDGDLELTEDLLLF